jgi:capsular exopolysaccharide synthesis family protein
LKHAVAELKVLQGRANRDTPIEPAESVVTPGEAEADVERAIQSDPVLKSYVQFERDMENWLADAMRVTRKASDVAIVKGRSELNKARERRKKYEAQLRSQLLARGIDRPEGPRQGVSNIAALELEVNVLTELEHDLEGEVGKFTADTKKLGSQAIEMESIRDDISSAVIVAKQIGDEIELLKLELNAPDRVRVLEEAKAPRTVDMSRNIRITGIAGGGAFVAIVLLLSFWEFRARRVDTQDDVDQGLGLKVVGTVPIIPRGPLGSLPAPGGSREHLWRHQLAESVDTIRIMLAHTARVASYRVVLVTSAVEGEGKTSLSSHLATSLARSGQRTLLIDGDLRWPMVHRLYDQPQEPGFCELVQDQAGIADAIRPTATDNLWIIPAGRFDEQALSILAQSRARILFDQLREQFDFIVVDSAPVLLVADTLLLSQHVDAAVFSILRDVSQVPKIEAAYQRITALGVPTLGAVVSGIDVPTYSRYRYGK